MNVYFMSPRKMQSCHFDLRNQYLLKSCFQNDFSGYVFTYPTTLEMVYSMPGIVLETQTNKQASKQNGSVVTTCSLKVIAM